VLIEIEFISDLASHRWLSRVNQALFSGFCSEAVAGGRSKKPRGQQTQEEEAVRKLVSSDEKTWTMYEM